jgi:hypothetical protein
MWHEFDLDHLVILTLVYIHMRLVLEPVLDDLLAQHHDEVREKKKRKWKTKSPKECPSCKEGIHLGIRRITHDVQPWSERKSSRGRRKKIATEGYACLHSACDYFGITDETVHALVENGKRDKKGDIQTFKCQCCQASFSARRNTPLYY